MKITIILLFFCFSAILVLGQPVPKYVTVLVEEYDSLQNPYENSFSEYYYNNQGQWSEIYDFSKKDNQWELSGKTTIAFDLNNDLVEHNNWKRDSGVWKISSKTTFEYNADGNQTFFHSENFLVDTSYNGPTAVTYSQEWNDSLLVIRNEKVFDKIGLNTNQTYYYYYDNLGRLAEKDWEVQNATDSVSRKIERAMYHYDGNKMEYDTVNFFRWNTTNLQWDTTPYHRTVQEITYDSLGRTWSERFEWQESNVWERRARYLQKFNTLGQTVLFSVDNWILSADSFEVVTKYEQTFNPDHSVNQGFTSGRDAQGAPLLIWRRFTYGFVHLLDTMLVAAQVPQFLVFPNPTADDVQVVLNDKVSDLSLYNSNGQLLVNAENKNGNISLSLAAWPNGLYYVSIVGKDGSRKIQKIIKQGQ